MVTRVDVLTWLEICARFYNRSGAHWSPGTTCFVDWMEGTLLGAGFAPYFVMVLWCCGRGRRIVQWHGVLSQILKLLVYFSSWVLGEECLSLGLSLFFKHECCLILVLFVLVLADQKVCAHAHICRHWFRLLLVLSLLDIHLPTFTPSSPYRIVPFLSLTSSLSLLEASFFLWSEIHSGTRLKTDNLCLV